MKFICLSDSPLSFYYVKNCRVKLRLRYKFNEKLCWSLLNTHIHFANSMLAECELG